MNDQKYPDFLTSRTPLTELIANHDWSATPIGPIQSWPQSLKTVVSLILHSTIPMVTLWREEGVMIYNDAYADVAGARHPQLLGSNVREGWTEVADFNDTVMKVVLAGETLAYRDQELILHREGRPQRAWMNLDYSPIHDEHGKVFGVMAIVVETTEKVEAERWLRDERERLRRMFEQAPGFIAMLNGPDHVFDLVNPAFMQLVGHRDVIDRPAREAFPEVEGQGFFEQLREVYRTGEPFAGTAMPVALQRVAGAPVDHRFIDLVFQPVRGPSGNVVGIFAQGTDVTERVLAEYELDASEERNRQILDSAIDYGIVAMDLNGRITRWNEGARRIFQWVESEMLGSGAARIFTPEDRADGRVELEMATALEKGVANDERWHLRKDGSRFWANGEMTPIRNADGTPVGLVKVLRDRTSEHLAAQALKISEDRLQRAQDAGGIGLFSLNLLDNMMTVTPQVCRIFGLDTADAIPAHVFEKLVVAEDRPVASTSASRNTMSAPLNVEYQIRRADNGERRAIARKAEFETDADGRPVRMVGIIQDVTDRRAAQNAMRESEAKFRALAQAMPNQVWTALPSGDLDWFNERVYDYSGANPGDLDGRNWASMVHPDDVANAAKRWATAVSFASTYETEFRLKRADGVYRWYIARAVPVHDDAGSLIRWIGTNTDIEELRAARERLAHLNETLEQQVAERTADRDRMWRLSTDILLVADFSARIIAVNPAWTSILGWSGTDLAGRSFMDLVHPEDMAGTAAEVGKLTQGVKVFTFVNRYRCKDGSYRLLSWTAVPDEQFIHGAGRDITAERKAAEALKASEAALQQAQKMESIGNLTGGVAHDFNNLLQVVSGNLQLLRNDVTGNERAERRIENALMGVARGSKLASQLLAFGRRQALDPRVINIGRFVSGMDDMLRRSLGEEIEIETMVAGGLWNTSADPTQIENAVLNLAINARDAMDGAGRLTIEVGNAELDETYVRTNTDVTPGQYVVLSVTDTGTGMTPEIMSKVFEPFFSTKPEGKGTGLGLSMVFGFVKQSGGHVKIYSEVGLGTTIKIYLPRSIEPEDLAIETDNRPISGGTETILVAEDDDAVRSTVVEILSDLGYRVLKASDAASALHIIESGIHIDLLFTDVVMPGPLKSTHLARQARQRMPNLAVLFTSGYTENSIVHGGRLDAGVQLLSKPYTREALARKIRHVLGNQAQLVQARNASEHVKPNATSNERAGGISLEILLVEDDGLIRMNTADMLSDLGHKVTEAGSGEEALKILEIQSFDVIITDLGLPGIKGAEFVDEAMARRPGVPIVFATGDDSAPSVKGTRSTLLKKPYGEADLARALASVTTRS